MSTVGKNVSKKDLKLLVKIVQKIIEHPNESKYGNINASKLIHKFQDYIECIDVLQHAGFEYSEDGSRFIYNTERDDELQEVYACLVNIWMILCTSDSSEEVQAEESKIDLGTASIKPQAQKQAVRSSLGQDEKQEHEYLSYVDSLNRNALNCGILPSKTHNQTHPHFGSNCQLDECIDFQNIVAVMWNYQIYNDHSDVDLSVSEQSNNQQTKPCITKDVFHKSADQYEVVVLLNNFNHLLDHHSHQFEDIYNQLKLIIFDNNDCELSNCLLMLRHQRDRHEVILNDMETEQEDIVMQQLLDRIHCHYMHSFDIGFKLTQSEKQEISDKAEVPATIRAKHTQLTHLDGFDRLNSKFNRFHDPQQNTKDMKRYSPYSFGYRFYYWSYYKHCLESDNREYATTDNKSVDTLAADWYIEPKHDSLKSELINNPIATIHQNRWDTLVKKAKWHIQTDKVKTMVFEIETPSIQNKYDMQWRERISINHLISMMAYCNFTALSFAFSNTYRKINANESDDALRGRHRNYGWMGRYLRECTDCFGTTGFSHCYSLKVYHGVTKQFTFESMIAYIKGPFSTTSSSSVASTFCGGAGMVLELELTFMYWTQDTCYSTISDLHTNVFQFCDMRWISDYVHEQEIFFIGGLHPFIFNTIGDPTIGTSYRMYMNALKQILYDIILEYRSFNQQIAAWCVTHHCHSGKVEQSMISPPSSMKERTLNFALLSHQIWKSCPQHPKAKQFKNCDAYFDQIMDLQFQSVKTIVFEYARNSVVNSSLQYENGWINLDLFHKIFPNVQYIKFTAFNQKKAFITDAFLWNSILSFVQLDYLNRSKSNKISTLNKLEIVLNQELFEDVQTYIESMDYGNEFLSNLWFVHVGNNRYQEDQYRDLFRVGNDSNPREWSTDEYQQSCKESINHMEQLSEKFKLPKTSFFTMPGYQQTDFSMCSHAMITFMRIGIKDIEKYHDTTTMSETRLRFLQ
eukprot:833806_1